MRLYHLEGCPYCRLVRDKLDELGLAYELVEVPARRSDRTEVIRISGQPLVPVLVDGDTVLDDEEKILAYLDARYGRHARPAPADSEEAAWEAGCLDGG